MMSDETKVIREELENLDRRRTILNAGQALIVAEGLEGFRIREVAQRAGMHHATLLHYYPNREALINGVIRRIVDLFGDISLPGSSRDALSPREALHADFQHVLAQMQAHPDNFIVLQELFLRSRRDEAICRMFATVDKHWHAYLSALLQAGVAQGSFRADLDTQVAATLIMTSFKGLSMHTRPNVTEAQQVIDQIEQWIIGS